MLKIIKTKERIPYRPQYYKLIEDRLSGDGFNTDPKSYALWRESPFLFVNMGVEDNIVKSYASMVFTDQKNAQALIDGKIKESQLPAYTPGSFETPYLYWMTLILENRQHGPYLIKSIFREIENTCRDWELSISHVYSIAFTKLSERLMRRYYFKQAGVYEKKYPIMIAKVNENPYLKAFIPQF